MYVFFFGGGRGGGGCGILFLPWEVIPVDGPRNSLRPYVPKT